MPTLPDQTDILAENEQLRARVCELEGRRHNPESAGIPYGTPDWDRLNPKAGAVQGVPTPAARVTGNGTSLTDLCRAYVKPPATAPQGQPVAGKAPSLTDQCLAARR